MAPPRVLAARVLLALTTAQAALIFVPSPTWTAWMLHFAALETSLVGTLTGLAAVIVARRTRQHRFVARLAAVCGLLCLVPALSAVPAYVAASRPFSLHAWFTGGHADADVDVERDVVLAPGLLADLYRAPGSDPHPFVVVVHGGGWRHGDKGDAPHISRALAAAGVSVVDVRYRLAPFPAGIADVKCMLGAVRARAAELGVDPARAALLGRSAGAQIALVAAYSDDTVAPSCPVADHTPVKAVASIYGPTDMAWAHDHPYFPDVVDGTASIEIYLGGPPSTSPEAYRLATPQTWVAGAVPTLLVHGTGERCVRPDNATKLASALEGRGVDVRVLLVPFADHGFDVRPGGFGDQLTEPALLEFFQAHL